jgi:hypothetical protein
MTTLTYPTCQEFLRVQDGDSGQPYSRIWHYPFPGKTYPLCTKERDSVIAVKVSSTFPEPFCEYCKYWMNRKFTEKFVL